MKQAEPPDGIRRTLSGGSLVGSLLCGLLDRAALERYHDLGREDALGITEACDSLGHHPLVGA